VKVDVLAVLGARGFRLAAGFLIAVLTARFLGPEGRGEYFFVVTLAAMIMQFANLGMHSSNTYLVARDPSLLSSLLGNSSWISVVAGGGLAAGVVASAYAFGLFGGAENPSLLFAVALAPLGLFFLLGQNLLIGLGRTMAFNATEILGSAVLVLFPLVTAIATPTSPSFLAARSAAILASIAGLLFFLARGARLRWTFDRDVFRKGLAYAARAYVVTLLGFLLLRANVFLLQVNSGFGELGLFSVAAQVADALELVPTSIALVLFPRLVRMNVGAWSEMIRSLRTVAGLMAGICLVVAVLSEPLVVFAFGPEYLASAVMLRLLLPQVFFIGVTTIVSQYLAALGMPVVLLLVWGFGLAAVTAFGLFLIPAYGGVGAALAPSLTYALVFALVLTAAFRRRAAVVARTE
jgi:O-antigen/teichoic acid export membrane protein